MSLSVTDERNEGEWIRATCTETIRGSFNTFSRIVTKRPHMSDGYSSYSISSKFDPFYLEAQSKALVSHLPTSSVEYIVILSICVLILVKATLTDSIDSLTEYTGYTPAVEPVGKFWNGSVRPVGITCKTGEIPVKNDQKHDECFCKRYQKTKNTKLFRSACQRRWLQWLFLCRTSGESLN